MGFPKRIIVSDIEQVIKCSDNNLVHYMHGLNISVMLMLRVRFLHKNYELRERYQECLKPLFYGHN